MIDADLDYVRRLLSAGNLQGPVLELGTGYGGQTCRDEVLLHGLQYVGTDLRPGPGVDIAADFESDACVDAFEGVGRFQSALVLNVLEHTFDPIRILDNVLRLLSPSGTLAVITPAIWALHNYPMDCWRLLPDFYRVYAERRGVELLVDWFEYVGFGRVDSFRKSDGALEFPPPSSSKWKQIRSRIVHKVFNTAGRSMAHPSYIAVGATFRKSG